MKANCHTSYCAWYITFLLLWIGFGILLSLQESINMSGILCLKKKFHLILNNMWYTKTKKKYFNLFKSLLNIY